MLTKNEKEWLENRDALQFMFDEYHVPFLQEYSLVPDLSDALEFSERVAAKLALGCESQTPCNGCWRAYWKLCNLRKGYWDCADCFLKVARLKVEEEMNGKTSI